MKSNLRPHYATLVALTEATHPSAGYLIDFDRKQHEFIHIYINP